MAASDPFSSSFEFDFPPLDDLIDIPLATTADEEECSHLQPLLHLRPLCPSFADDDTCSAAALASASHDNAKSERSEVFLAKEGGGGEEEEAKGGGEGSRRKRRNKRNKQREEKEEEEEEGEREREGDGGGGERRKRRECKHCGVTATPQWREGPLGPKTLCNACGVGYKKWGGLLPEYRPAASPTFLLGFHSNSHRGALQIHHSRRILSSSC